MKRDLFKPSSCKPVRSLRFGKGYSSIASIAQSMGDPKRPPTVASSWCPCSNYLYPQIPTHLSQSKSKQRDGCAPSAIILWKLLFSKTNNNSNTSGPPFNTARGPHRTSICYQKEHSTICSFQVYFAAPGARLGCSSFPYHLFILKKLDGEHYPDRP